jgi:hypothetical protein
MYCALQTLHCPHNEPKDLRMRTKGSRQTFDITNEPHCMLLILFAPRFRIVFQFDLSKNYISHHDH